MISTKSSYNNHQQVNNNDEIVDGSCSTLQIVDKSFKKLFYRLGYAIGEKPGNYILVPIFISFLLGTGLQRIDYRNDPEYLYAPTNGEARRERNVMEHFFPVNYSSHFNPSRLHRLGKHARLFVTTLNKESSLLRVEAWEEILRLDKIVQDVQIIFDEQNYTFSTLCARWNEDCFGNDILEIGEQMAEIEAGNLSVSYPVMFSPSSFKAFPIPILFGGLVLSNQSTVLSAKAVQLNYFLDTSTPRRFERGFVWESAILDAVKAADPHWKFIRVVRLVGRSLPDEVDKNAFGAVPYMFVAAPFMVGFAVLSCMMADCVRSKPWMGFVGVMTSMLGTTVAFGLLCYCGIPLVNIAVAAPFLMLGIGLDDAFVMLAAWRQTSVHDPVPKRMAETYSEAAVSITITSLTDMLSFIIGIATPFPAVQIFSTYTAGAVLATYIFHVFFFGGALALSGYHEAKNRHSILWWLEGTPKSKMATLKPAPGKLYRLLFTGGLDPADPHNPQDHSEHSIMLFFRDTWANLLSKPIVKGGVLLLFALYLAAACLGISRTEEGMQLRQIARDDSYAANFFDVYDDYFRNYPYRIQVALTGDLEYSDPTVQSKIERMMVQFESTNYTRGGGLFTESWLRSFLRLADRYNAAGFGMNISSERQFIQNLQDNYLQPSSPYSFDVVLNEDKTKVLASRFIIQPVNIRNTQMDWSMVRELRQIAKNQDGLNVTVFSPFFSFTDQALIVRSTTIQCVSVAGIVMMVLALIFIPNPLCALWVAFSVLSIEAGVLGFLTFWRVNLDALTMLNLIMCIGFSVDFSAHISYAYMAAKGDSKERLRSSLYSLGLPIVQGATSTILSIAFVWLAPSYALKSFCKAVILVMVIAAAHGLLILPVLLSLFGPGSFKKSVKKQTTLDLVESAEKYYRKNDKDVL